MVATARGSPPTNNVQFRFQKHIRSQAGKSGNKRHTKRKTCRRGCILKCVLIEIAHATTLDTPHRILTMTLSNNTETYVEMLFFYWVSQLTYRLGSQVVNDRAERMPACEANLNICGRPPFDWPGINTDPTSPLERSPIAESPVRVQSERGDFWYQRVRPPGSCSLPPSTVADQRATCPEAASHQNRNRRRGMHPCRCHSPR